MKSITNSQAFACASPREVVKTLSEAFAKPFDSPDRMHCDLSGNDAAKLLVMPAWQGRSAIGVKVATVMPDNCKRGLPTVDGVYVLMDGQTGQVTAILEAPALTALRTAGVSALASRLLSRELSKTLLIVGTGALAPHMARAHTAVRDIETVLIWGRRIAKAEETARALSDLVPTLKIEVVSQLDVAVQRADIVSCATLSSEPLILDQWVQPGTHLDFVGSFTPEMREADPLLFNRARAFVDTQTALKESGDLIAPQQLGLLPERLPELAELVSGKAVGRTDDAEITLFKSVGTGLSDIAVAQYIAETLSKSEFELSGKASRHG
ncbi:MAG: ornithine cyclodeaminase family protein [Chloroflexota bacterium]